MIRNEERQKLMRRTRTAFERQRKNCRRNYAIVAVWIRHSHSIVSNNHNALN